MSFKPTKNAQTGATEYQFHAVLQSISTVERKTSKGKGYFIGSVSFKNPQGEREVATCFINAANFAYGMETGKSYVSTLSFDANGQPTIRVSHLEGAARASMSMFAGLTADAAVTAEEAVEEN
jgi:hypothetical protein